jgi:hypothetical protein
METPCVGALSGDEHVLFVDQGELPRPKGVLELTGLSQCGLPEVAVQVALGHRRNYYHLHHYHLHHRR